ncbi:MAG: phage integrase SAM-like domain and Arm DNA-binding domain-containing protein [Ferruginibacter sp.]
MANSLKVLFWLHRTKTNKEGLAPLILRLSYQKIKVEKATGYYVNANEWNIPKQRLKGNSMVNNQINEWLTETVSKISLLTMTNSRIGNIHLPSIMEKLFAEIKEEPGLLKVIRRHNDQLQLRVGKDYSYSTYEKYLFTYDKVKSFILNVLKKKDVLLRYLTVKFIMDFDHYLKVNENNQHNTAVKYCINLKRVINVAVLEGLINHNPFNSHKRVYKDTTILETAKLFSTRMIYQISLVPENCGN